MFLAKHFSILMFANHQINCFTNQDQQNITLKQKTTQEDSHVLKLSPAAIFFILDQIICFQWIKVLL